MSEYSVEKLKAWLITVNNFQLCNKILSKKVSKLGLTLAQHEILIILLRDQPLSQQELCKKLLVTKGGISVQINKLIETNLVERQADKSDGRISLIKLTAQGEALAQQAFELQKLHVALMFDGLSDEDALAAIASGKTISQNLSMMEVEK